ncbi:MAG: flagellar biosynthesis anti-sigma factor FlgM [Spirochaetaceae bacterium]
MTIERLGPTDPVQKPNRVEKNARPEQRQQSDSIQFSDEAKLRAELLQATETVKAAEDVRMDRVAEVKKKLEDPSYINDEVLGRVADRIMDMFEL